MLLFTATEGGHWGKHWDEKSRSFSGMGNRDFSDDFEEVCIFYLENALSHGFHLQLWTLTNATATSVPWFASPESKMATAAMPEGATLEGPYLWSMSCRNAARLTLTLHLLQWLAAPCRVILCHHMWCPKSLSPLRQSHVSLSGAWASSQTPKREKE